MSVRIALVALLSASCGPTGAERCIAAEDRALAALESCERVRREKREEAIGQYHKAVLLKNDMGQNAAAALDSADKACTRARAALRDRSLLDEARLLSVDAASLGQLLVSIDGTEPADRAAFDDLVSAFDSDRAAGRDVEVFACGLFAVVTRASEAARARASRQLAELYPYDAPKDPDETAIIDLSSLVQQHLDPSRQNLFERALPSKASDPLVRKAREAVGDYVIACSPN